MEDDTRNNGAEPERQSDSDYSNRLKENNLKSNLFIIHTKYN